MMRPFTAGKAIRKLDPEGRDMRRMERQFETAVRRALNRLRLDTVRDIGDDPQVMLNRLSDSEFTRPFQDAITRELERVALAGADYGYQQVERYAFGVKAIEVGVWELANNAAVQWALGYGYELIRGLLQTTRDWIGLQISEYVRNSETIGQLTQRIRTGTGFAEERARRIAVTEVTRAFSAGNRAAWKASGVIERKEVRTNNDELVCKICGPLNGKVFELDDPEGDPPFHVNCILPGNEVVIPGRLSAATKSFYDGRAVEITVRSGRVLTVTENHPILTPSGYVAAKLLREGGYVISARDADGIAAAVNPDDDHVPTVIEEVFRSFKESAAVVARRMPATAEDFHGDGRAIYGDVDIVYIDRLLESDGIAALPEQVGEFVFSGDGVTFGALLANSMSDLFRVGDSSAARCVMCGADLLPPLVVRHERPFEEFGFGTAAGFNPGLEQSPPDGIAPNAHPVGNGLFGFTGEVAGHDLINVQRDLAVGGSSVHSGLAHDSGDDVVRHALLAGEFMRRFAADIAADEIVGIREFVFSGHVYDLQCDEYELYITSGIVTSNCRCWIVPKVI